MTTLDPEQAVQTGLWELLRSDPAIMQTVTDVLDEDPELRARQYPYVSVPDVTSTPDDVHDRPGRRVVARIHTRARGDVRARNERPENLIGARIVALLDHGHRTLNPFVSGHTVWMVHIDETRKLPDADRSVRHRMDTVSIWTCQD